MSSYAFDHFIQHEIETTHKNIDRLNTGIHRYKENDPRAAGIRLVLVEQEKQLKFLEQLKHETSTFDTAMTLVKQMLILNEEAHHKAAQHDLSEREHSVEWWETLHQIEYLGEFIRRIHAWQAEFAYK